MNSVEYFIVDAKLIILIFALISHVFFSKFIQTVVQMISQQWHLLYIIRCRLQPKKAIALLC